MLRHREGLLARQTRQARARDASGTLSEQGGWKARCASSGMHPGVVLMVNTAPMPEAYMEAASQTVMDHGMCHELWRSTSKQCCSAEACRNEGPA